MSAPLVSINSAPREELEALYGVGPRLAERVVQHRERHGPFHGPEALARVEGFGIDLAITLAPHIDWDSHASPREEDAVAVGAKDWVGCLVVAVVSAYAVVSMVVYEIARGRISALEHFPPESWLMALQAVLFLGGVTLMAAGMFGWSTEDVLPRRSWRKVATRSFVWTCAIGVFLVSTSGALHYAAIGSPGQVPPFLLSFVFSFLALGPQLLVSHRPGLVSSRGLAIAYDAAFVVLIPMAVVTIQTIHAHAPLPTVLLYGVVGVGGIFYGVQALRGRSDFLSDVQSLVWENASRPQRRWMAWLNARVPSPEDQRALQAALNQAYPPSRLRSVAGAIVIGAGGWLVITALGAIVEWIVQGWLDRLPS